MGEISQLLSRLSSTRRFSKGGYWILPLHSSVSPADQRQAFRVPPKGVRSSCAGIETSCFLVWNLRLAYIKQVRGKVTVPLLGTRQEAQLSNGCVFLFSPQTFSS